MVYTQYRPKRLFYLILSKHLFTVLAIYEVLLMLLNAYSSL